MRPWWWSRFGSRALCCMCPISGFCQSMMYSEPSGANSRSTGQVGIARDDQVLAPLGLIARPIVHHLVLLGAKEPDVVVDQHVALDLGGEMSAADEFEAGGRAHPLRGLQEVGASGIGGAVPR